MRTYETPIVLFAEQKPEVELKEGERMNEGKRDRVRKRERELSEIYSGV